MANKPAEKLEARKHSVEEQLDNLELMGLGFVRIPGTDDYASYRITVKNGKVVKIKSMVHPGGKQTAEDEVKIDFVKLFVWERDE